MNGFGVSPEESQQRNAVAPHFRLKSDEHGSWKTCGVSELRLPQICLATGWWRSEDELRWCTHNSPCSQRFLLHHGLPPLKELSEVD